MNGYVCSVQLNKKIMDNLLFYVGKFRDYKFEDYFVKLTQNPPSAGVNKKRKHEKKLFL